MPLVLSGTRGSVYSFLLDWTFLATLDSGYIFFLEPFSSLASVTAHSSCSFLTVLCLPFVGSSSLYSFLLETIPSTPLLSLPYIFTSSALSPHCGFSYHVTTPVLRLYLQSHIQMPADHLQLSFLNRIHQHSLTFSSFYIFYFQ